jgi:predicted CXXCH cytochrome family protein
MGDVFVTGTDEICVFCHTPHGSNTTMSIPLWNKAKPASTTYTAYTSTGGTMQGTAPTDLGSNMSLACLSCHDGTQAMDNMLNQPGQGGFNKNVYLNGARLGIQVNSDASTSGAASGWYQGTNDVAAAEFNAGDTTDGKLISGAGVDFIGTDLSNDHPIGIAYAGGSCTTAGANTGCADQDFNSIEAGLNGNYQVGSATAGVKTAMRLYGTTIASATVECASCHDPHSDAEATFLRTTNAASGVCLTCHVK